MPQILYPPARAQSIREVLETGFDIFKSTFNATLPYAVLAALSAELANLHNLSIGQPVRGIDSTDPVWWAWNVGGLILSLLLWSALILRQKALAAAERSTATAELRSALVLLSRLIAVVALSTVAVMIGLLPFGMALPLAGVTGALTPASALIAVALSPLTLPAAYLSVALMFAAPVLVLHKLGPIDAMIYSVRLVRGHWWRTAVLISAAFAVLLAVLAVLAVIAAAVVAALGVTDVKVAANVAAMLGTAFGAICVPLVSALVLAMLGDLRVRQQAAAQARPPGNPS